VIATAGDGPGQVHHPRALAADAAGNLYIADWNYANGTGRMLKRDARGDWSVIATYGTVPGPLLVPTALTVDAAGNLYVAHVGYEADIRRDLIQKRDAQGRWSVLATYGAALGQVIFSQSLAVDTAGNLYVAESNPNNRVQKRDARGHWSLIATPGEVHPELLSFDIWSLSPFGIVVDPAGNLYVTALQSSRVLKKDAQENWSVLAEAGDAPGQVLNPQALAMDGAGNLYVADRFDPSGAGPPHGRIQKRDAQGNWSVIAPEGVAPGQVFNPYGLAVDNAGNLLIADRPAPDNTGRIQQRDARGNWSVIDTQGLVLNPGSGVSGLVVDGAGRLYVASPGNFRVQVYTPSP
jgi:sugar lactone lactonase YvrE